MSRGASPIRVRRARGRSFLSQAGAAVHRRKLHRLLAVMALAVVLGLSYVWQHIQTNLIGYRLREVELQNQQLRREIGALENQAAQLTAPARLDELAQKELGLVRQGTWDLVILPEPLPPAPEMETPPPGFWSVQATRWRRVATRVQTVVGTSRALAAPPGEPGKRDGEG